MPAGRPPTPERLAIPEVLRQHDPDRRGMTWLQIAPKVPGWEARTRQEFRLIRSIVNRLADAGELVRTGRVSVSGCNRPQTLFALPAAGGTKPSTIGEQQQQTTAALAAALALWGSTPPKG